MRVLHIMASGERGGGADHLLGVMPELALRGVDCLAAVGSNGPLAVDLRAGGFAVRAIELMRSRSDPRGVLEVARVTRALRPDLVHLHGTRAGFFGALARVTGRWPSVYSAHGLSYRKERSDLRRALFAAAEAVACRGATRVVSVSRADLEDLERRLLVARGRGTHIANAVDHARFSGDRAAARTQLGVEQCFVVGTVSRLVEQKAVADLIEAVARCSPGSRLLIVGDGPQRWSLAQLAARRRVDVTFLGERDDVPALLPAFDLFALTSRWEGEPVALLEAMAAGLPCVATDTAGAREVLGGGSGVLVGIGAPESMAAAIERLRGDPEERARLAAAGRGAVAERSFANVAARLHAVYDACSPG